MNTVVSRDNIEAFDSIIEDKAKLIAVHMVQKSKAPERPKYAPETVVL